MGANKSKAAQVADGDPNGAANSDTKNGNDGLLQTASGSNTNPKNGGPATSNFNSKNAQASSLPTSPDVQRTGSKSRRKPDVQIQTEVSASNPTSRPGSYRSGVSPRRYQGSPDGHTPSGRDSSGRGRARPYGLDATNDPNGLDATANFGGGGGTSILNEN
jgi:hypothetical protein